MNEKVIRLSKIRIVKEPTKIIQEHPGVITEKIFAPKDSVIMLEYAPNHRPIIREFTGV